MQSHSLSRIFFSKCGRKTSTIITGRIWIHHHWKQHFLVQKCSHTSCLNLARAGIYVFCRRAGHPIHWSVGLAEYQRRGSHHNHHSHQGGSGQSLSLFSRHLYKYILLLDMWNSVSRLTLSSVVLYNLTLVLFTNRNYLFLIQYFYISGSSASFTIHFSSPALCQWKFSNLLN